MSIPKVEILKTKRPIQCQIWVVNELFQYTYPFLLPNFFKNNLAKSEFHVYFYIFEIFASPPIEKRFLVYDFIQNYPSSLSNQGVTKIKKYFIEAIQLLEENQLIKPKPNEYKVYTGNQYSLTNKLTTQNISEEFIIYEILKL